MTTDAQALSERLLASLIGAAELITIELGRELGLYAALRDNPMTAAGLARATRVDERYAQEWLEQQAAAGFLRASAPATSSDTSASTATATGTGTGTGTGTSDAISFTLADGVAEVFLDEGGPNYLGTAGEFAVGLGLLAPRVIETFRSGEGVPYSEYGRHMRHGIAAFNRPMFLHQLTTEWLPAVPDIDERLRATPAASVLDLGCGTGQSSIAMARAYPHITVRGIDLDENSISEARSAIATAELADRVTVELADAGTVGGEYDLVTIFEALHDMGDPVGVLKNARDRLTPTGSVFIGDERVEDQFTAPASEIERLQYAFSVLHCLPATRAEKPIIANGTILRAPTLMSWARQAGFETPEVLDIPHDFWRFYRLR
jgi:cyclopropane fatty-acyl-phospholipid synthase-like methyltransferase